MVAFYHNVTNNTVSFQPAARQVQLINHSFKIYLDEFDVKPQIDNCLSCSILQSGLSISIALEIRVSILVTIYCQGGWGLLSGNRYFRGSKGR